MEINLIPDNSVGSAPVGFAAVIEKAAAIFEQDIPGDYTVNITYGWGTFDNVSDDRLTTANSDAFSIGGPANDGVFSYATVKDWLTRNAILPEQLAAIGSLPVDTSGFPNENQYFDIPSAQQKALGIYAGSPSAIDGSLGFNTSDTSIPVGELEEAALQEIGHALGQLSGAGARSTLDAYRYSAPGVYEWTPYQPAYFSLDGGETNLGNYLTSGDATLFQNAGQNDPFALPFIDDSSNATLTNLDLTVLHVMGFGGRAIVAPEDFNGDGTSDLLWEASNGTVYGWMMSNGDNAGSISYGDEAGYAMIGSGDFSGGRTSDMLWRGSAGDTYIWSMDNGAHVGDVNLGNTNGYTGVVGDYTGDGTSDIVWEGAGGDTWLWTMSNGQHIASNYLGNELGWSLAGSGDLNGNGASDLIWENKSNGQVYEWNMEAGQNTQSIYLGAVSGYTLMGTGDYSGNGISDLIWKGDSAGDVWEWVMNSSGQHVADEYLGSANGYDYVNSGSYTGSAAAEDIIWKGSSGGDTWSWSMSNNQHTTSNSLGNLSGWTGT